MSMKVGIINATGYAGAELVRLLSGHPEVEIRSVTGRSHAGKQLAEIYPHLGALDLVVSSELDSSVDFVFSALPHATSATVLKKFLEHGIPCVDISADFRLKDLKTYEEWYKVTHPCPQFIDSAVYGLPEVTSGRRKEIVGAKLIANPGCFPTGVILGLAPALAEDLIELDVLNDSKTGVSGAGRTAKVEYGFSELNDNCLPYAVEGHRHMPEIVQELTAMCNGRAVKVSFFTTLVPLTRGILGSSYARFKREVTSEQVLQLYLDYYADEPFIRVVNSPASVKQAQGSNLVFICPVVQQASGSLAVFTALDNLVKGAAGAAVQNMNLMTGFDETTGLKYLPLYP